MREEREIAGFALPFVVGILISAYISLPSYLHFPSIYGLFPTFALVPTICLMHPVHLNWNDRILLLIIISAGLFCGLATGANGSLLYLSTSGDPSILERSLSQIGNYIRNSIEEIQFTDKKTGGIISALLTGDKSGIPLETIKTFRNSGASHVLALSGLHLGIIYGILTKILAAAGNSLSAIRLRSVCIMIVCCIYSIATGAGDSIKRALLFIIIRETALLCGRKISLRNIFFCALVIQLTLSPLSCRSAGFQLSYAAIAGIAFIYPRIIRLWNTEGTRFNLIAYIWKSAAVSISCQITTGPLAWLWFGSVPQYFLLTNLIAVPLTGLIIPISIITVTLHALGLCPQIITRATECLVSTLTDALEIISDM